jgi:catechol 2,3-dioxygenase-like lactoylglutathione lyase family enzyme
MRSSAISRVRLKRRIWGRCIDAEHALRPASGPAKLVHMPAASIRVRQIDHVTFVVRDLEASRAFYEGVLGMECVPRPAFSFPGLWFQAGSTQIHLILEHPESGPAGVQRTGGGGTALSRTHHIAFEVDEAKPAIARLTELGIPIVSGPKFRPDGPTQFYVLDPDGNLIELFAVR